MHKLGDEKIPAMDDDDDVIVVPQEEPVITEIPDDDDNEPNQSKQIEDLPRTDVTEIPSSSSAATKTISVDAGYSTQPVDQNMDDSVNENDGGYANKNNESDVQILEPQISIMNLDEYEETNVTSTTLDDSVVVKIKEEPKYEGYEDDEDDGFEDVGTFEAEPVSILDEEASGTVLLISH